MVEIVIAPSALYLLLVRKHLRKDIEVAAQNVYDKPNGAFTGEISATQLSDSGITWVLAGHSERRTILKEDDKVGQPSRKRARYTSAGSSILKKFRWIDIT